MSYKLKYTGEQIDNILDRAVEGGTIDDELALKAPLESPALTGTPTAPTQAEGDDSTKVATTAYADRAADAAGAAAEAAAKGYTDAATGALYITDTASGAIASFPDGADAIPMKSFVCSIEPIQAGSGDPSPSNIRAISGHTGVNAVVAGKNLWNGHYVNSGLTSETNSYNDNFAGNLALPIQEGKQYTFSASGTGKRIRYKWLDKNTNDLTNLATSDSGTTNTAPTGARYLTWRFYPADSTAVDLTATGMMEEGSAISTFEAYNGTTYPVTFYDGADPLTVYKGTIDLVSGVLTVTHKRIVLSSADQLQGFAQSAQYGAYASIIGTNDVLTTEPSVANGWCSNAEYVSYNNRVAAAYIEKFRCWNDVGNSLIFIRASASSALTTKEALFNAYNGAEIVYKLATPQIVQLTPTQVLSLRGQNNVWSNTGDVEVEYVADPKLYIAKMLGGGALTLGSASPLSLNRPVTISEEDLEQADEVNEAVEAAVETVLPAESGETEEGAQE